MKKEYQHKDKNSVKLKLKFSYQVWKKNNKRRQKKALYLIDSNTGLYEKDFSGSHGTPWEPILLFLLDRAGKFLLGQAKKIRQSMVVMF